MQYLRNGGTDQNLIFIDDIMVKLISNDEKQNFYIGSNCYQNWMTKSKSALQKPMSVQQIYRYFLILRKTTKFSSIFIIRIRFEH
jgi:hypothetical protein